METLKINKKYYRTISEIKIFEILTTLIFLPGSLFLTSAFLFCKCSLNEQDYTSKYLYTLWLYTFIILIFQALMFLEANKT